MTVLDEGARSGAAGSARGDFYVVAEHDDLLSIARRFGREPWQIIGAGGLAVALRSGPPHQLEPGERLHFTSASLSDTVLTSGASVPLDARRAGSPSMP